MIYETIACAINDGVAVVTLNRPDVMNALNSQMRAELTHAVRESGKTARVVVLTGAGRAFCSGQDLGAGANPADIDLERTLKDEYMPMLEAITTCPVPTIAAVNGPAAGAGANLALATDVVIGAESAYFLQAFTRIGLIPDAGGTYVLPRQMGLAKSMGVALFADKIFAREASAMGMIWEFVADEKFSSHWQARAAHLAEGPTLTYGFIKTAIRSSFANSEVEQLNLEARLQGDCGRTRDFKEGVTAFLDKRRPKFEGR